ncbi:MAG: hypothetical protein R3F62_11850 [Planctomycetota bacterium]
MDDLPQPNYAKPAGMLGLAIGLSCMGLFLVVGALTAGMALFTAQSRRATIRMEQARVEAERAREAFQAEQEASRVTLLLAARQADRGQVQATADVLRERLRLAGIEGEVGVRADLKLQIQLPGEGLESAIDLLLAGGDLQFKLVSTLAGAARDEAVAEVEAAKAAGTYDPETAPFDVGHSRTGEAVLMENPGVPGYLLTEVTKSVDGDGNPAIGFTFGEAGRERFRKLTGENLQRNLAIVLDGVVRDTPTILAEIQGSGILNNPGGFTTEEQERLVTVLRSGKLPVDLDLESQDVGE